MPDSTATLDYAVATLKKYPQMVIEVRGFTDNRGAEKQNLVLSKHRAETVMNYLKDHGVTNSMTAKGFGKENPITDNKTADGPYRIGASASRSLGFSDAGSVTPAR